MNYRRFLPAITFLYAALCRGHTISQSAILLDFDGAQTHIELQVPVNRFAEAYALPLAPNTPLNPRVAELLTAGLLAWNTAGRQLTIESAAPPRWIAVDGAAYIQWKASVVAPPGVDSHLAEIEDDVILARLPAQSALVSIRTDWRNAIFANEPQLIGVLRSDTRRIPIDREQGSWTRGFGGVFHLGMRHIAEGSDHILFLLALLLPAPLAAVSGRWSRRARLHSALLGILKVITAFTLGHSITLAAASLGLVRVPSHPIEVFIAVSILISAIHALRPIFPGREAAIAGFFGLVHGLAFASTLTELGLVRWEKVQSLLAFNLGIETMQITIMAASLPSLILLSRGPAYRFLRIGGAIFAGGAATGWIVERLGQWPARVDIVVDGIASRAGWIAAAFFLAGVAAWSIEKVRRRAQAASLYIS